MKNENNTARSKLDKVITTGFIERGLLQLKIKIIIMRKQRKSNRVRFGFFCKSQK